MLSLRPMLVFIMEDMDMVLDMLVLDMLVLDMLDTDMDILPMGTLPLDTMARDLLMLSQRPRLMLDSTMEDMDMVLDMPVLAMLDMDIAILPMALATVDTIMVKPFSFNCSKAKAQGLTIIVSTVAKAIGRITIAISGIAKTGISKTISISSIVESSIGLGLWLSFSRPLAIVSKGG